MKKLTTTILLGAFALVLRAQDAAPPSVDLKVPEIPAATPLPSPDVPDLSQIDEIFKQTSLGKQADERRLHIQWRRLANEVANDPEVIAAKAATRGLHTDLEKRQRLRAYYTLYYERMKAKATSDDVRSAIEALKASHLSQTSQPRVRPSPTPEVSGTPSPTPTSTPVKKKHKEKHKKKIHK